MLNAKHAVRLKGIYQIYADAHVLAVVYNNLAGLNSLVSAEEYAQFVAEQYCEGASLSTGDVIEYLVDAFVVIKGEINDNTSQRVSIPMLAESCKKLSLQDAVEVAS